MSNSLTSKEVAKQLGVSVSTVIRVSKKLKKGVKIIKRGSHRNDRRFNQEAVEKLSELLKVKIVPGERVEQEADTSDSLLNELRKRIDSLEQDKKNYIKQIETLTGLMNSTNEAVKQINQTLQGQLMLSSGNNKEVIEGKTSEDLINKKPGRQEKKSFLRRIWEWN